MVLTNSIVYSIALITTTTRTLK